MKSQKDPEINIGRLPQLIIIVLIMIMIISSCSIQRRISREWKSSPGQERLNLFDSYYTIKENWDPGYARNQVELDSIILLIKTFKK